MNIETIKQGKQLMEAISVMNSKVQDFKREIKGENGNGKEIENIKGISLITKHGNDINLLLDHLFGIDEKNLIDEELKTLHESFKKQLMKEIEIIKSICNNTCNSMTIIFEQLQIVKDK